MFAIYSFLLSPILYADEGLISLQGNFIQGGLVFGQVKPGAVVRIDTRTVRVSKNGDFIIGFGRNHPAISLLTIDAGSAEKFVHKIKIEVREYDVQHIAGLPDKKVNPDPEILERIRNEAAAIAKARSRDDSRLDFKDKFIWPVKGPITGVYGSERILNGEPRQPHYGIDIAAPTGTKVLAPAAGIVTYINKEMYFSGGTLVLDHGHNLSSSFLHLHKIHVKLGDRIQQGQMFAEVGATGRATGPHLDWRMNWKQQRIDPSLLINQQPTKSTTLE